MAPFGIQNIGCTCYLNSTLQAIHSSPLLKKKLQGYTGDCEFTRAVNDINVPKILQHLPQFQIGTPHDAHEILLSIIDKLEVTLGKSLFYGTTESTLISRSGKKTVLNGISGALMFTAKDADKTLDDLYKKSLENEYIVDTGSGSFVCKQTVHTNFPDIIVCVIINSKPIDLPETFQGRKLNCIVSHMGDRDAGHYIAVVRDGEDTFLIDDDTIFKADGKFTGPVYVAIYS